MLCRFSVCLLFFASSAIAQTSSAYVPTLTFDVVSIKENHDDINKGIRVGGPNLSHSGLIHQTNMDAMNLVSEAYGFNSSYMTGIPDIFRGKRYDIDGKSTDATNAKLASLSDADATLEKRHMLQAALADRFKLQVHPGTKQADVLSLTVTKSGPKFQPAQPKAPDPAAAGDPNKPPPMTIYQRGSNPYEWHCEGCTMTQLASILSFVLGTKTIDNTGLTGTFAFVVRYKGRFDDGTQPVDPDAPPMDTALQNQLGLKVDHTKGEVQTLTVDHMELPSEN